MSTGRVCDGYGVWGGGENDHDTTGTAHPFDFGQTDIFTPRKPPATSGLVGKDESSYFEWFKCRTVVKLPGAFGSAFWDTLVLQASLSDPAVLHAVVALSSAHKMQSIDGNGGVQRAAVPNGDESYVIKQYLEAIKGLESHFSARDRSSLRVTLITCIVFICLEFLRGHYRTGSNHLRNGMKILSGMRAGLVTEANQDPIDDWLAETFTRLNVQAALLGYGCSVLNLAHHEYGIESSLITFKSMNEARNRLDRLQSDILALAEEFHQREHSRELVSSFTDLLRKQQRIHTNLTSWLRTYKASGSSLILQAGALGGVAYSVLHIYYAMARIMTATCRLQEEEMSFDSHIDDFVSIITLSIQHSKTVMSLGLSYLHRTDDLPFIADIGWIAPLYYTALKCRNHRVRVQAIRLLISRPSRQGIWNALIAASVAKEVMELEEMGFYRDVLSDNDFALNSEPQPRDLALPVLPETHRMHDVQVVLPDELWEDTVIACKRRRKDGSEEAITRRCAIPSQYTSTNQHQGIEAS